jgi:hypothetical protein
MNQPILIDCRNQCPQTTDLSPVRTEVLDRGYVELWKTPFSRTSENPLGPKFAECSFHALR